MLPTSFDEGVDVIPSTAVVDDRSRVEATPSALDGGVELLLFTAQEQESIDGKVECDLYVIVFLAPLDVFSSLVSSLAMSKLSSMSQKYITKINITLTLSHTYFEISKEVSA